MKLKYQFVAQKIDNHMVAVPIGAQSEKFNGMVKLNETGYFVFDRLGDETARDQLIGVMFQQYAATQDQIAADLDSFLDTLRDAGLLEE